MNGFYRSKLFHSGNESQRNIKDSKNPTRINKVLLYKAVCALCLLTVCAHHSIVFFEEYLEYPTVQSLRIDRSGNVKFPAVTVCNNNKYRYTQLWKDLINLGPGGCRENQIVPPINAEEADKSVLPDVIDMPFSSMRIFNCGRNDSTNLTEEEKEYALYYNSLCKADKNTRYVLGHEKKILLEKCSFSFRNCNYDAIMEYNSLEYGNCYKIMPDTDAKPSDEANAGLKVRFNIEKHQYFNTKYIINDYGIRIALGPRNKLLNIEKEGNVFLRDKTISVISISQFSFFRQEAPYFDNCKDYKGGTQLNCLNECIQLLNLRRCACYDPTIGDVDQHEPCNVSDLVSVCCIQKSVDLVINREELCHCGSPCVEIKYEMTLSYLNPHYSEVQESSVEGVGWFKIYFSTLDQVVYSTEPKYTLQDLLGAVGGHLGLFLGVSLLSSVWQIATYFDRFVRNGGLIIVKVN